MREKTLIEQLVDADGDVSEITNMSYLEYFLSMEGLEDEWKEATK